MPKEVRENPCRLPAEKLEIKKHVAVIHSSNRLTLLQRKIANALLYHAYPDLMTRDEHVIHIARLCTLIGYKSNDHKTIKKALVNLLSTVLEWNLVDKDKLDTGGVWNASSIIADASIDGAICTYSYSNKMRRLLYRPDIYAKIDLAIQARFQSSYGLALYENCNRYRSIGKTPWFTLETFRKLMGVEGNKYTIFRDFKTRVIDKAIEEVNACSSIHVESVFKRENRKVTSLRFQIQIKENTEVEAPSPPIGNPIEMSELAKGLIQDFGMKKAEADAVLSRYGEDHVRNTLSQVSQSVSFREGTIRHLKNYLLHVLESHPKDLAKGTPKDQRKERVKARSLIESGEERWQRHELVDRYYRAVNSYILQQVKSLSETQSRQIEEDFRTWMLKETRGIYQNIYMKEGMKNPLIEDQFCLFVRQRMPGMLEGFATLQAWQEQIEPESANHEMSVRKSRGRKKEDCPHEA